MRRRRGRSYRRLMTDRVHERPAADASRSAHDYLSFGERAPNDAPTGPLDWLPWATNGHAGGDPPDDLAPPGHPPSTGLPLDAAGAAAPARSLRAALGDRLPATLRGGRLDPSPRGAAALALVSLLAALAAAIFAWHGRPTAEAVPTPGVQSIVRPPSPVVTGGSETGAASSSASPAADIVVDVAGRVRRPGVVHVPVGSRVVDAIAKAGGVLPGTDTTGVALARKLSDGEQVLVTGRPGRAQAPAAAGAGDAGSAGGASSGGSVDAAVGAATPVNLNTATEAQLDGLPGVGPVLAQRIIQWRDQHGSFTSTRQLGEVDGLGEKRLAQLLPLVTV